MWLIVLLLRLWLCVDVQAKEWNVQAAKQQILNSELDAEVKSLEAMSDHEAGGHVRASRKLIDFINEDRINQEGFHKTKASYRGCACRREIRPEITSAITPKVQVQKLAVQCIMILTFLTEIGNDRV
jgi:hypothetical protein